MKKLQPISYVQINLNPGVDQETYHSKQRGDQLRSTEVAVTGRSTRIHFVFIKSDHLNLFCGKCMRLSIA